MRFILINPKEKTVSAIDIEPSMENYYKTIGCTHFEGIGFDDDHLAYFDGEARLFPDNEHYNTWFKGGVDCISGNILLSRTDTEGGEAACTLSVDEVRNMIDRFTEGFEVPSATVFIPLQEDNK